MWVRRNTYKLDIQNFRPGNGGEEEKSPPRFTKNLEKVGVMGGARYKNSPWSTGWGKRGL